MPDQPAHEQDRVDVSGPTTLDGVDAETFDASGHTTVTGDAYADRGDLSGHTEIRGDLRAVTVTASGATTVAGDAAVETVDASGSTTIDGDLTAVTVDASGSLSVGGHAGIEELDASGATRCGSLAAETAAVSGDTTIREVTVDTFDVGGALEVEDLDAATLTVRLGTGDVTVDHLDAGTVTVQRTESRGGVLGVLIGREDGRATVETLVAEEVSLVDTTVTELTAETASIGPGCRIECLRAAEWEIDDDATVEQTERVARPPT